jgi:hypothetical protein
MGRLVAHTIEIRNLYRILIGKPKKKRPLRRPRSKLEDNIKIDLK